MANIQVRRKSSGAITAVRFKRERPDVVASAEFAEDIVPLLGVDRDAFRFANGRLDIFETGGWCTVRAA